MHKVDISILYIEALEQFAARVGLERPNNYKVYTQSGRKYDKVIERTPEKDVILYYVDRETGTIYGRKNDIAPNKNWWFHTIYTAHKWDWSGWPKPVSDDRVEVTYEYGNDIVHYELKGPKTVVSKPKRIRNKKYQTPIIKHEPLDMATTRE